ncbi:hypothetical protein SFHH103_00413 [Sinorhizobium fredii HH103]|uniref:Uncharacterized protein n=2 Tax=Rhizobium fredii TaxID=380 RepID=G9A112_SINF1|nr:hypothetical protein SFHH103_00413 [Sinorhizobium fredii HH103]
MLSADLMQPIPRLDDGHAFMISWSGGVQSAEAGKDQWRVLPVLHEGKPCVNGFYSKSDLGRFMKQRGLKFVAFQHIQWMGGAFNSHWAPLIPGQSNFSLSPANVWGNVSRNLSRARIETALKAQQDPSPGEMEAILDAKSEPERLAQSIALSLRNLDTSVEQVSSFYNQELTNQLAAGKIDGSRSSSMRDQVLYAQVHSFFLHLGAARDYLATFIALQLGKDHQKYDAMGRLIEAVRTADIEGSMILKIMEARGYVSPRENTSDKWSVSGWLKQATDLRNEFVHKRTYGHKAVERMGHLRPIDLENGLYRYFRPIALDHAANDVFDVIIEHYEKTNELFYTAAKASGFDASILHLTDKDIISIKKA